MSGLFGRDAQHSFRLLKVLEPNGPIKRSGHQQAEAAVDAAARIVCSRPAFAHYPVADASGYLM
jgi:hypothetical protein